MNQFKIGDRVRAVRDCSQGHFKKGWEGFVIKTDYTQYPTIEICFYNGQLWWAFPDEIELIESTPKPFPTFEEFDTWYCETEPVKSNGEWKWTQQVYNYFAQFQYEKQVEVPLELGKIYEFSSDKKNWEKRMLHGYSAIMHGETKYYPIIRPIQPSRLEHLMEKHPNLTDTEQAELLDLLLTQNKQNK